MNSAHGVTLTNIFSWKFCVNLNREVTHRDQKESIFSFQGLGRWSALSQTIYKRQEMWCMSTRHKTFRFLTEEQQGDRETCRRPVATLPKDAHSQEWQWKPGSKPP